MSELQSLYAMLMSLETNWNYHLMKLNRELGEKKCYLPCSPGASMLTGLHQTFTSHTSDVCI